MENKDDPTKKPSQDEKPDSQMQNEQISSSLLNDEDMDDEAKEKVMGSSLLDNDALMETSSEKNKEVAQIEIKKKDE